VRGAEAVPDAVKRCWASLWTARAIGYRRQHNIDHTMVSLAVVVQQLVDAKASGVLFTANPINGQRDQVVINATWGLGEAIVGGLVTPDTFMVNKATGQVLQRDIADKQVMTVRIAGGTHEQSVPENLRRAPALDDTAAIELMRLGVQIEQLYKMPMDIEWVLCDHRLAIVQARPITALPEPEAPLPAKWKMPKGCYAAMRNNIVELMTKPLTPLFGTLGRSCINASMGRVMTSSWARPDILPARPLSVSTDLPTTTGFAGAAADRLVHPASALRSACSMARSSGDGTPALRSTVSAGIDRVARSIGRRGF
jgi:pyruvate,water dikinase